MHSVRKMCPDQRIDLLQHADAPHQESSPNNATSGATSDKMNIWEQTNRALAVALCAFVLLGTGSNVKGTSGSNVIVTFVGCGAADPPVAKVVWSGATSNEGEAQLKKSSYAALYSGELPLPSGKVHIQAVIPRLCNRSADFVLLPGHTRRVTLLGDKCCQFYWVENFIQAAGLLPVPVRAIAATCRDNKGQTLIYSGSVDDGAYYFDDLPRLTCDVALSFWGPHSTITLRKFVVPPAPRVASGIIVRNITIPEIQEALNSWGRPR